MGKYFSVYPTSFIATALILSISMDKFVYAETISVAGVVVRKGDSTRGDSTREAAAPIGLYTSKQKGGRLGGEPTSQRGVYSVAVFNASAESNEVWVMYDGNDDLVAEPRLVKLGGSTFNLRKGTADDLELTSKSKRTYTRREARESVKAIVRSQQVKMFAGVMDREASKELIEEDTVRILSRTTDDGLPVAGQSDEFLRELYEYLQRHPDSDLPNIDTLFELDEFRKLKLDRPRQPSVGIIREGFPRNLLDELLRDPDRDIENAWISDDGTAKWIHEHLTRQFGSSKKFRVTGPGVSGSELGVSGSEEVLRLDGPATDREIKAEIKGWLSRSPAARRWVFYQNLLESHELSETEKDLIRRRVRVTQLRAVEQ
jgi:hypothetical protein